MVTDDPHLMTLILTLGNNMKSALFAVLVALTLVACGEKAADVSAVAASAAVAAPTVAEAASGAASAAVAAEVAAPAKH